MSFQNNLEKGFDTSIPTVSDKMLACQCKASFPVGNTAFDSQDFLGFGKEKQEVKQFNFTGVVAPCSQWWAQGNQSLQPTTADSQQPGLQPA